MSQTAAPGSWRAASLGEACLKVRKVDPKVLGRETFRYVDIGAIDNGRNAIRLVEPIECETAPSRARQLLQTGDTVFSTVRPYLKNIAWVDDSLDGEIASTGFCVLRPNSKKLLPRFLFFFSLSDIFLEQILPLQRGVSYPAVRDGDLLGASIPLPPLAEQERIVEILEEQLSRLDAAVKSVQTVRESISRFRRSVLASCFGQSELSVGGPGHTYQSAVLGEHVEVVMGQAPPGSECNVAGIGTPFVKAGEFSVEGPIVREWTTRPLRMARQGDVLLCVVGATCGKVNRSIDCAIGRSVAALRPGESLDSEYLYYFMLHKTEEFRKSSQGSAQGVITRGGIREQRIPLPGILRQQEIARYLQEQFEQMQTATRALERAERKSVSLRRSLLHSAFTGELTRSWRGSHV